MDQNGSAMLVVFAALFAALVISVGLVTRGGDERRAPTAEAAFDVPATADELTAVATAREKITTREQLYELLVAREAEIQSLEAQTIISRLLLEELRDQAEALWPEYETSDRTTEPDAEVTPEAQYLINGEAVETGPQITWNSITKVLTWNGVEITEPGADGSVMAMLRGPESEYPAELTRALLSAHAGETFELLEWADANGLTASTSIARIGGGLHVHFEWGVGTSATWYHRWYFD